MKCENCKHQFCWLCLGEYYGYKHSMADNGAVCGLRPIIGLTFISICGLSVYLKLLILLDDCFDSSFIDYAWPIFVYTLWFIWLTIKYALVAAAALGIEWGFNQTFRGRRNRIQQDFSLLCGVCLLLNSFTLGRYALVLAFFKLTYTLSRYLTRN